MRISVFTREERERKRKKKKDHFIFSAVFNLVLDQIQFSGDLAYFCDEEVQKTQVFNVDLFTRRLRQNESSVFVLLASKTPPPRLCELVWQLTLTARPVRCN